MFVAFERSSLLVVSAYKFLLHALHELREQWLKRLASLCIIVRVTIVHELRDTGISKRSPTLEPSHHLSQSPTTPLPLPNINRRLPCTPSTSPTSIFSSRPSPPSPPCTQYATPPLFLQSSSKLPNSMRTSDADSSVCGHGESFTIYAHTSSEMPLQCR